MNDRSLTALAGRLCDSCECGWNIGVSQPPCQIHAQTLAIRESRGWAWCLATKGGNPALASNDAGLRPGVPEICTASVDISLAQDSLTKGCSQDGVQGFKKSLQANRRAEDQCLRVKT